MKKEWEQFEEFICEELKEFDPYIRRTKGSGNKGEKGDLKFSTNLGLHIECKKRNTKSPFKQEWLDKVNEEIPFHSNKIGIVITENKNKDKIVHLGWRDFFELLKRSLK
ncbi:MAG: hypothetical protein ACTSWG_13195 [Candidatus Helarchaeota archaeon]